MAFPNVAGTGRFLGPYQFIHMADTSSYAVGNASTGDTFMNNSSLSQVGGVIHGLAVTVPTVSATAAAFTLMVDGSASTITIGASTFGTVPLDIGFNRSFVISCSSGNTTGVLTYLMSQP